MKHKIFNIKKASYATIPLYYKYIKLRILAPRVPRIHKVCKVYNVLILEMRIYE